MHVKFWCVISLIVQILSQEHDLRVDRIVWARKFFNFHPLQLHVKSQQQQTPKTEVKLLEKYQISDT